MGPLTLNSKPAKCPTCNSTWGVVDWIKTAKTNRIGLSAYIRAIQCGLCSRELT